MSDDEQIARASPGYAFGQLERAVLRASWSSDRASRDRAEAKVRMWRQVLDGMASGRLDVGSRAPVAGTPAWVTLEVAHGGFATGRYLAERALTGDEQAWVRALPDSAPGRTDRERLNLWYLSDAGQQVLRETLRSGRYRVEVPEDAALLVVTWLLENEHDAAALDLAHELMPFMDRLRFTPRFEAVPQSAGTLVRREPVEAARRQLRAKRVPPQIEAMRQTLRVWHPLYDRLVALWCSTVGGGEPPRLVPDGNGRMTVRGGWPCQVWPEDWSERRDAWLTDYQAACRAHAGEAEPRHPKSNFARLQRALQACPTDSRALTAREVGWIRRALANTIGKHGEPASEPRTALRATQAAVAAQPTHAALAEAMATRLDPYPADGGIPSLDPIVADIPSHEDGDAAVHPVPAHLTATAARALEAPVEDLVARGVIPSGEVLATVLPQLTAPLMASSLDDPTMAALYAQTYAAFRRRRSLLLLNLQHQVQFDELPWIGALAPLRHATEATARGAREALRQTAELAVAAFPHTILPNPLVREIGELASQAQLTLPLVEEVAADIFMGTFTTKWRTAAAITSRTLAGTLYARYYDLPDATAWERPFGRLRSGIERRWGKHTAEDFAELCRARAVEAGVDDQADFVARNGAILEQSQILTTHNLAVLINALDLQNRLGQLAPELADRTLAWVVRRQTQPVHNQHAALQMIKNVAYAWRNAIFYLSLCDAEAQVAAVEALRNRVAGAGLHRFEPAVHGLAHIVGGGRFTSTGTVADTTARRLLGWSVGHHWCLPATPPAPQHA
ncbi:hypothetical protein [Haloechinothrix salitolerans]|uniref:Uncharacterized protein n=1 Tax=Haloechinothrix salitolerans TaxID=926830 RepID=A0ABW2C7R7_9PSEU